MDEHDEIAAVLSKVAGRKVKFDESRYAYVMVCEDGEEVVAGYADEDVIEIVDYLLDA